MGMGESRRWGWPARQLGEEDRSDGDTGRGGGWRRGHAGRGTAGGGGHRGASVASQRGGVAVGKKVGEAKLLLTVRGESRSMSGGISMQTVDWKSSG